MTGFLRDNRAAVAVVSVFALLVGGLTWLVRDLPDAIVEPLVQLAVREGESSTFAEDGLYVVTTGTGAPLPDPGRAGPQTLVIVGGLTLAFDSGPGSTRNIETMVGDASRVDALFMTHYHSDHIGDMGELFLKRWGSSGRDTPLPVHGPPGVGRVVAGFEAAYALDVDHRIEHHGEDVMPPRGAGGDPIEFDLGTDLAASAVVFEQDGVRVTAFNVDHEPVVPAVGYRVEYGGRSVVISGDLAYHETFVEHARAADLLVSEALDAELSTMVADAGEDDGTNIAPVAIDIIDYHITPEQAGIVARDAGNDMLLITHILPPVPTDLLVNTFLADARAVYDGPVRMAKDGTMVFLPAGSDDLVVSELGA